MLASFDLDELRRRFIRGREIDERNIEQCARWLECKGASLSRFEKGGTPSADLLLQIQEAIEVWDRSIEEAKDGNFFTIPLKLAAENGELEDFNGESGSMGATPQMELELSAI